MDMEQAFLKEGIRSFPAVICYEGIYIRDHWETLVSYPWWYQYETDIDKQMLWRSEVIKKTGQDWMCLPVFYSHEDRKNKKISLKDNAVFLEDMRTGSYRELNKPEKGGWSSKGGMHSVKPENIIKGKEDLDRLILPPVKDEPIRFIEEGCSDLAKEMISNHAIFPIMHIGSPLWYCYQIWGFEGMMITLADDPDLIVYACNKYMELRYDDIKRAALMGAKAIWIEECFTDMISPELFEAINVPLVRSLAEEIKKKNMYSIYYYCGNPAKKMDMILSCNTDALSLEESKKGFKIDIYDIAEYVNGRCTLLGNLDTYDILEKGTQEQLKDEIKRQLNAGRRNDNRFIMSLGSPVTPGTSIERVRLYCDMVHDYGR